MELSKASLYTMLLEEGEEDLAVLVARSELPDIIDSDVHAPRLEELGLERDEFLALLPPFPHRLGGRTGHSSEEMEFIEQTVSARWADLVEDWTGRRAPLGSR